MRFFTALVAATGAVASGVSTEVVTAYTTYCSQATTLVHGGHTYSIATPGHITMTNGPYTVTRPLLTSTVTQCQACSTAVPHASSVPVIPGAPGAINSTPLVPSAQATGASGSFPASTPSPTYNAGVSNAVAGAGAGLGAVFAAVALLL